MATYKIIAPATFMQEIPIKIWFADHFGSSKRIVQEQYDMAINNATHISEFALLSIVMFLIWILTMFDTMVSSLKFWNTIQTSKAEVLTVTVYTLETKEELVKRLTALFGKNRADVEAYCVTEDED